MQKNSVFIVRPFGESRPVVKKNKEGNPEIEFFNFEKVEKDLIQPALKELNLDGGTTQRIFVPGEIKEDMFSQLLLADIVIADITIHNANVFYELGIRHALRCKTTILIKCDGFDDTPFDIIGYKYISYQKNNLAGSIKELVEFLKNGAIQDRKDSPVFNMLPKLKEPDQEKLLAIPESFLKEVLEAAASKRVGRLLLLAEEAAFFQWYLPASRVVGEELYKLKPTTAAQPIWEKILEEYPGDYQGNDRLATIYQRLAENEMIKNKAEAMALLLRSDSAIESLLRFNPDTDKKKRAEVAALKGRNFKTRWLNSWKNAQNKPVAALQSSFIEIAYKNYEAGFFIDLNHYYSGINALALLTIKIELATQNPKPWADAFDTDEDAFKELELMRAKQQKLTSAVQLALEAEKRELIFQNQNNIWFTITEADFVLLTSKRPSRVVSKYLKALETATEFEKESVLRQINLYKELNILPENVKAVIQAIAPVSTSEEIRTHFILFTGHMIDAPGRKEPRFPPEKENSARSMIKEKLADIKINETGRLLGIAGGACGGDILFHELCSEMGIPTELYLALPPDKFRIKSVNHAGNEWIDRFNKLCKSHQFHILCDTETLPKWLRKKEHYNIWERNNLWLMNSALINGGMHMTLLALWDGKTGDSSGGTQHMVEVAKARGAKTIIIDITKM